MQLEYILKEVASIIQEEIYLPNDYIIYKDQLGSEMCFLIEGKVKVLSPNETQIVKILEPGKYFGELAIFENNHKRVCSYVAHSFCIIGVLKKDQISKLGQRYPIFEKKLKLETQKQQDSFHYFEQNSNEIQISKNNISQNDFNNNENQQMLQPNEILKIKYLTKKQTLDHLEQEEQQQLEEKNEFVSKDELELFDNQLKCQDNQFLNNKQSRRIYCKSTKERRYSRITLGTELKLSKLAGLKLSWGINNS